MRLIRKMRAVGVVLEPLDPLGAVAGPAVEVFVAELLLVEPVADDRQEAGELREDQDLVPFLDDLGELRQEHVELGAGLGGAGRVDQAGVAGGLAEPEQGLEDLDLRAVQLGGVLAQQRLAVVRPELLVELALRRLHVAVEGLLGLLGEVLDDLRPWSGGG